MKKIQIPMGKLMAVCTIIEGTAACWLVGRSFRSVKTNNLIKYLGSNFIGGILMGATVKLAETYWEKDDFNIYIGGKKEVDTITKDPSCETESDEEWDGYIARGSHALDEDEVAPFTCNAAEAHREAMERMNHAISKNANIPEPSIWDSIPSCEKSFEDGNRSNHRSETNKVSKKKTDLHNTPETDLGKK